MIDYTNEIWRPVAGYEGSYEVSSMGRVRSLDRVIKFGNKTRRHKGTVLKEYTGTTYNTIHLCGKTTYVHVLVAKAFPEVCGEWFNGYQVDHIDTNPQNNICTNLRSCSERENHNNPLTRIHISEAKKGHVPWNKDKKYDAPNISKALKGKGLYANNNNAKPILQYSLDGELIKEWDCIKNAADALGIKANNISGVAHGHRHTAGGYIWRLKNGSLRDVRRL